MRICRTLLTSQKGQSEILGLIIASAIGAIVIAATTTSFVELNKGQNNITKTVDALDIKRDIENLFSDKDTGQAACRANFQGRNGGYVSSANLLSDTGAVRYPVGQLIPGFNIRITSWNLANGIVLNSTNPVQQIMVLNLIISKGDGTVGPQTITRSIKLWTQRSTGINTAITECRALIGSGSDIWLRHDDVNDVYNQNPASRVFIGSQTIPPVPTPVNTMLLVLGPTQPQATMQASGLVTAREFDVTGNFTQTGSGINSVLGNVGLGTLSPTQKLDVIGDLGVNGNLTIGGALTGVDITSQFSFNVGTDLTVRPTGTTILSSTNVRGNANYNGPSYFEGDLRVDGQTVMASTLSVNGGSVAGTALGIAGTLETTGLVTVPRTEANEYCINGNCRTTFEVQTCNPGQVAYRNLVSGQVECSDISCAPGTYFRRMLGPNQPECHPLPTAICDTNEYISSFNAGVPETVGTYTCTLIPPQVDLIGCSSGYAYQIIAGVAQCAPIALVGGSCGPNRAVTSINSNGTVNCVDIFQNANACPSGQIQTGMQANGTPICSGIAVPSSCNSDGQVVTSMNNRTGTCGSVSIAGGNCPNGIKSISATGAVTSCN